MNEERFFTADTHFGHKNIFKHQPRRIERVMEYAKSIGISSNEFLELVEKEDPEAIRLHDEWIIDMWNKTVGKKDIIYILGDFSFRSADENVKILHRLNGKKYLAYGNHDYHVNQRVKNILRMSDNMLYVGIKKNRYDFLEESIGLIMCHYRLLIWREKHYGSLHLCGHNHGRLDEYNKKSGDLCVDVGLDGELSDYRILKLEDIYNYFKVISGGKLFSEYVSEKIEKGEMII